MRIEKRVFFNVLNALRNGIKINVNHPSFSLNRKESSHIVALLVKALYVDFIKGNPINLF